MSSRTGKHFRNEKDLIIHDKTGRVSYYLSIVFAGSFLVRSVTPWDSFKSCKLISLNTNPLSKLAIHSYMHFFICRFWYPGIALQDLLKKLLNYIGKRNRYGGAQSERVKLFLSLDDFTIELWKFICHNFSAFLFLVTTLVYVVRIYVCFLPSQDKI